MDKAHKLRDRARRFADWCRPKSLADFLQIVTTLGPWIAAAAVLLYFAIGDLGFWRPIWPLLAFILGAYLLWAVSVTKRLVSSQGYVAERSVLATQSTLPTTADHLIDRPAIEWNVTTGRVALKGQYNRAGGELVAYVTYGQFGAGAVPPQGVISGEPLAIEDRIKLGTIARFDRREIADITLGYVIAADAGDNLILRWGEKDAEGRGIGLNMVSYFGHIVLVDRNQTDDAYPFAIISRSYRSSDDKTRNAPPIFISPDTVISSHHQGLLGDSK